jgi:hypothetical protein
VCITKEASVIVFLWFYPFYMYKSMALIIFTHAVSKTCFLTSNRNCNHPAILFTQTMETSNLLSVTINEPILEICVSGIHHGHLLRLACLMQSPFML